jgi:hypothetical protein
MMQTTMSSIQCTRRQPLQHKESDGLCTLDNTSSLVIIFESFTKNHFDIRYYYICGQNINYEWEHKPKD